jgi:ABC-2 type transport system ATP-binding protein
MSAVRRPIIDPRAVPIVGTDEHLPPVATERLREGCLALGLDKDLARPVRELSGGNRRKVELIRALLHQPRFLLMDEATVGLDPASRQDLMRSVEALTRAGEVAVLWATHLVDEVVNADRVLVLNQGLIVFDGTPAELMAQAGGLSLEQAFLALCLQGSNGRPPA